MNTFAIELTDGATALLNQVVMNGLHGDTQDEVAERLICQSLEERRDDLLRDINMEPMPLRPVEDAGVGPGAHA